MLFIFFFLSTVKGTKQKCHCFILLQHFDIGLLAIVYLHTHPILPSNFLMNTMEITCWQTLQWTQYVTICGQNQDGNAQVFHYPWRIKPSSKGFGYVIKSLNHFSLLFSFLFIFGSFLSLQSRNYEYLKKPNLICTFLKSLSPKWAKKPEKHSVIAWVAVNGWTIYIPIHIALHFKSPKIEKCVTNYMTRFFLKIFIIKLYFVQHAFQITQILWFAFAWFYAPPMENRPFCLWLFFSFS